jgi:hypothetical protein
MSITAEDIVIYASQNMPTDDSSLTGGDIDSNVRVVFTDIDATGTITAQSDNNADSGTLTVTGRNRYGSILSESFSISGTVAVSGSEVFERILIASIDSSPVGEVALSQTQDSSDIANIYSGETGFRRPFYDATANLVGGANKTLYEKVFVKNNSSTNALLSAGVVEVSSGLYSIVDFGLERSQQYTESIANRLTLPTGVPSYGSGLSGVPGSDINPSSYQGIWLKLDLVAGEAAANSFYEIQVQGGTT